MRVVVDPVGLGRDGAALSAPAGPTAVPPVAAPAADPVSQSIATALSARALSLSALLAHGEALRAVGDTALRGTAAAFVDTDSANAARIAGNDSATMPGSVPPAAHVPVPELPSLPALPAAPTMPGDAFTQLVHSGPGGSPLREVGDLLRSHVVAALRDQADGVIAVAKSIDVDWQDDGLQRAGANTVRHGDWIHRVADDTEALAGACDDFADQLDQTRRATPAPEDFQLVRTNFAAAQAAGDPIGMARAAADYSQLHSRALDAMLGYHGGAASTTAALDTPLSPAPSIAGTGSSPDDVISGDDGRGAVQAVDFKLNPPTPAPPPPSPAPEPVPPPAGQDPITALMLPPTSPQPLPPPTPVDTFYDNVVADLANRPPPDPMVMEALRQAYRANHQPCSTLQLTGLWLGLGGSGAGTLASIPALVPPVTAVGVGGAIAGLAGMAGAGAGLIDCANK